jgi:hypothetical protein
MMGVEDIEGERSGAMSGSRPWVFAAAALAVCLAAALAAVGMLAASRGGGEDTAAERKVAELEEQVVALEEQEPRTACVPAAVEERSTGSRASGSSSGGYAPADDQAQLEALALAIANCHCPDNRWQVGETVIDGAWARVSVCCPSDPHVQGECLYFHKLGGSWQYVTCGTGLCYGDIPGAPASIYP